MMAVFAAAWHPQEAMASCAGTILHVATGADEGSASFTFGSKGSVWVNNFANNQFHTWRALGVFQNSTNLVEAGWFVDESVDQRAHPYKTWVSDGVLQSNNFPAIDVTPRDQYHTFEVSDINDDNIWIFLYDGSALGPSEFASIFNSTAFALTESEAFCTSDSRLAHFRSLKIVKAQGGTFKNYGSIQLFIEDLPWRLCLRTVTSYDVVWSRTGC